jgi:para-aminobenzoate synthetase component I
MSKDTAILQMNELGKKKIPFIFLIDFAMKECIIERVDQINPESIVYDFSGKTNYHYRENLPIYYKFSKYAVPFSEYEKKFKKVLQNIKSGNTYLLNLTCQNPIKTNLSLKEIFTYSRAKYKIWYKDQFTFFSPETFIKIFGNRIYSFPMKGTIDASIKNAAELILNDPKEKAEHYTIVDLIRNDLSMVAKEVRVEKFRYTEEIKTNQKNLLQVSSVITGILAEDYHERLGDMLFQLLPAGSVTGAPKSKTVDIISEIEKYDRGFYTGVAGIFDGTGLDSTVMIRFIEKKPHGLYFKSGGGITSYSEPEKEYREMIDKIYVPFV